MTEFKFGDWVERNTSRGPTRGRVMRRLTEPTRIKGHEVAASAAEPRYPVESDATGAEAAPEPEALRQTE